MLSYCKCAQAAGNTKLRKKIGSSVAYKTIGTFLSQEGHTDANGLSTNMHNEAIGCSGTLCTTAKQQLLDLLCRHVTEFTYNRELHRSNTMPMADASRCAQEPWSESAVAALVVNRTAFCRAVHRLGTLVNCHLVRVHWLTVDEVVMHGEARPDAVGSPSCSAQVHCAPRVFRGRLRRSKRILAWPLSKTLNECRLGVK